MGVPRHRPDAGGLDTTARPPSGPPPSDGARRRAGAGAFLDQVRAGFTEIYDLLWMDQAALAADRGPLARFANDPTRVLMRPTLTYAVLERLSRHPDVLRDMHVRERLLGQLDRPVAAHPILGRVVDAEREDLRDGDIPLFTARPSSRDLWTSSGVCLQDVLPDTGQGLVRLTMARLGPEDRTWQEWISGRPSPAS